MSPDPKDSEQKGVVLLVDDELDILKTTGRRLESAGYHVLLASNGHAGLSLAKEAHPDVIVLDVMMPVLTGREVLEALKAEQSTRHIPVIMLTGKGSEGEVSTSIDHGAVCHLTKPYQAKELLDEVKLAAYRHRLAHDQPA